MDKFTLENLTIKGLCIAAKAAQNVNDCAFAMAELQKRLADNSDITESERNAIRDTIETLS